MTSRAASSPRRGARAAPGPRGSIRWDRVGRIALLGLLGVILLLYLAPLSHWITQSRAASAQAAEVEELERERARLDGRLRALRVPDSIEREARRLGMVRSGERAFVVEGLPEG